MRYSFGFVAQLEEQLNTNQQVGGSIPFKTTNDSVAQWMSIGFLNQRVKVRVFPGSQELIL